MDNTSCQSSLFNSVRENHNWRNGAPVPLQSGLLFIGINSTRLDLRIFLKVYPLHRCVVWGRIKCGLAHQRGFCARWKYLVPSLIPSSDIADTGVEHGSSIFNSSQATSAEHWVRGMSESDTVSSEVSKVWAHSWCPSSASKGFRHHLTSAAWLLWLTTLSSMK